MKTQEMYDRKEKVVASNRRAGHDFFIVQDYEAGICLTGTEVKSLRQGKCNIQDAYAGFPSAQSYELYLYNLHISPYKHGNISNHAPKRQRKLLLHANEISKLKVATAERGMTIIPLAVYFSGRFVKIQLGLVKAKRKYDKRETNKKRESDREVRRKYNV